MASEHRPTIRTVGFLLIPGFALMSYASAVEPLRAANSLASRDLYRWLALTPDGAAARPSLGGALTVEGGLGADIDALVVCAGGNPAAFRDEATFTWLRRLARRGTVLGGVSGGPYLLARAGLLAGHRCTIHWEHLPAFVEEFPDLHVTGTLFEIDRARLTCAGGIAALDMMHALIERDHGHALAAAVGEWFLQTEARRGGLAQRLTARERWGVTSPKLMTALGQMERHLEEPLPRADVARNAGLSVRQLERLFQGQLATTFGHHYLGIRLDRAQALMRQTTMPILEVAVSTGFVSASHFGRVYRQRFGHPPRAEKNRLPAAASVLP